MVPAHRGSLPVLPRARRAGLGQTPRLLACLLQSLRRVVALATHGAAEATDFHSARVEGLHGFAPPSEGAGGVEAEALGALFQKAEPRWKHGAGAGLFRAVEEGGTGRNVAVAAAASPPLSGGCPLRRRVGTLATV